jgi:hypothetical protein
MKAHLAAMIAVVAQLAGCVSTAYYPDHWAERAKSKGQACPDIDGEYLNEGESFDKVGDGGILRHTVSLGELSCTACTDEERLGSESFTSFTPAYERFRLDLEDEVLTITATTADGVAYAHQRPVRSKCSGSMLQVEAGWLSSLEEEGGWEIFGSTFGMHILERASLTFGRAEDGSLLVRHSGVGSLMLLQWPILPVVSAAWIRFPAATPLTKPGVPPSPSVVQLQLSEEMLP